MPKTTEKPETDRLAKARAIFEEVGLSGVETLDPDLEDLRDELLSVTVLSDFRYASLTEQIDTLADYLSDYGRNLDRVAIVLEQVMDAVTALHPEREAAMRHRITESLDQYETQARRGQHERRR